MLERLDFYEIKAPREGNPDQIFCKDTKRSIFDLASAGEQGCCGIAELAEH